MLILTRKCGEIIAINDDIKIKILQIDGGQVRIGIVAPRSVAVHREEIYQKIKEENRKAAAANGSDVQKVAQVLKRKKNISTNEVTEQPIAGAA